jgi:hypothetical protein
MDFKKELKEILQPAVNAALEFPWHDKEAYGNWVAQTFYFVRHSTRLFALAASRCPVTDNRFHMRYLEHLNEEKGHEGLATADLSKIGLKVDHFDELPSTSALYQTQYYFIDHVSPYAFFGYFLALEGLAVLVGGEALKQVSAHHGPKSALFLKVHSEEDQKHLADVLEWIEKMPPAEHAAIMRNFKQSAEYYKTMLVEIIEMAAGTSKKAAA